MKFEIDVLMPCAGSGQFFEETLRSALNQSVLPTRIYVIDNACPHNTYLQIVNSFRSQLVDYVRFEDRLGMTPNWQRCLGVGSSRFVAFLHDDDLWESNYIEAARKAFSESESVGLVIQPHLSFTSKPFCLEHKKRYFSELNQLPEPLRSYFLATSNASHMCAVSFRRNAIGFFPSSHWMADQDFFAAHCCYGCIAVTDHGGAHIRLAAGSETEKTNGSFKNTMETLAHISWVTTFFIRHKGILPKDLGALSGKTPPGYYFRLIQACFSNVTDPDLYNFGCSIKKSYRFSDGDSRDPKHWLLSFLPPALLVIVVRVFRFSRLFQEGRVHRGK